MNIHNQIVNLKAAAEGKRVLVIGHKITDVDSYISSILMANLLKKEGVNAKAILLIDYNNVDDITKLVVEKLRCEKLDREDVFDSDLLFLVDHNNPFESYKEARPNQIIGIVDHHQDEKTNAIFKRVEAAGSTTKIIYDIYNELKYELSYEDKIKILYSLAVDTCALMSSKAKNEDKELAQKLIKELNISMDTIKKDTIFETDLSKSPYGLLKNGFKEYDINGLRIGSCYVEYFGDTYEKIKKIDKIMKEMKKIVLNDVNFNGYVLIFKDFQMGKTRVYNIYNKKIIKMTFNYIASRGSTIMPIVREDITMHNLKPSKKLDFT
ncbi:DHH family phosphoesterase [Alkaliphilus sp. B6464]|uniref:DHH family phosphoesterase n=1 Tax=Alkaliphilus sp. B6464 TaxID=2731219 RepID=UPI001BADECCA|nr:DHH family phosphoesterase [Alkaliphilus sp. B6464]QUH22197.1 DHH family phosphoesterase [Alkaliphilus sp. B6464]